MTQHNETIVVPDIGSVSSVDVIEILVQPGDTITQNQSLLTLESDKATMDIPAPMAGEVVAVLVNVGDSVSQGTPIVTLKTRGEAAKPATVKAVDAPKAAPMPSQADPVSTRASASDLPAPTKRASKSHASPGVRRLARELSLDLNMIQGSGPKSRVTRDDLIQHVKRQMQSGGGLPMMPPVTAADFTVFGPVETKPLNKIKRLTAQYMHRAWLTVPHVTQFDEADITELEAFRKAHLEEAKDAGYKLTVLAFVVKALTKALLLHPQFNASLASDGEALYIKQYFHIGIAVDTPDGLMVPVIKNADQLNVSDIAKEMHRLSSSAREKTLLPGDFKGGTFTLSSLGGIAGTAFTPIVNAPEVAILGLSRALMKPVYDGKAFQPRLMLPLSLSYDHRVIDGAEAARFIRDVTALVSDIRGILL